MRGSRTGSSPRTISIACSRRWKKPCGAATWPRLERLLDELRNILENLQTAQPNGRMTDPLGREMQQSMRDLEDMAREQQNLRDDTFRDGQNRRMQQGDRGRQQQRQGQRQRGQRGEQGENQEQAENGEQREQPGQDGSRAVSQRQQALRERLRELQRRMQGQGMQNEQGLGDAEDAMREAEGALGPGTGRRSRRRPGACSGRLAPRHAGHGPADAANAARPTGPTGPAGRSPTRRRAAGQQ